MIGAGMISKLRIQEGTSDVGPVYRYYVGYEPNGGPMQTTLVADEAYEFETRQQAMNVRNGDERISQWEVHEYHR
jgi:hypothetical protein